MPESTWKEAADAPLNKPKTENKRFYNYILRCCDGTLYSGYTTDPQRRLEQHNAGKASKYTRSRRPVEFAGVWQWDDKTSALSAEYRIKRLSREKKLQLIDNPETLIGAKAVISDIKSNHDNKDEEML